MLLLLFDVNYRRNVDSEKTEPQMRLEPTTLRDLIGCSNHWVTGDSADTQTHNKRLNNSYSELSLKTIEAATIPIDNKMKIVVLAFCFGFAGYRANHIVSYESCNTTYWKFCRVALIHVKLNRNEIFKTKKHLPSLVNICSVWFSSKIVFAVLLTRAATWLKISLQVPFWP